MDKLEKIRRLATVGLRQCEHTKCGDTKILFRTILLLCEGENEKEE